MKIKKAWLSDLFIVVLTQFYDMKDEILLIEDYCKKLFQF